MSEDSEPVLNNEVFTMELRVAGHRIAPSSTVPVPCQWVVFSVICACAVNAL